VTRSLYSATLCILPILAQLDAVTFTVGAWGARMHPDTIKRLRILRFWTFIQYLIPQTPTHRSARAWDTTVRAYTTLSGLCYLIEMTGGVGFAPGLYPTKMYAFAATGLKLDTIC